MEAVFSKQSVVHLIDELLNTQRFTRRGFVFKMMVWFFHWLQNHLLVGLGVACSSVLTTKWGKSSPVSKHHKMMKKHLVLSQTQPKIDQMKYKWLKRIVFNIFCSMWNEYSTLSKWVTCRTNVTSHLCGYSTKFSVKLACQILQTIWR